MSHWLMLSRPVKRAKTDSLQSSGAYASERVPIRSVLPARQYFLPISGHWWRTVMGTYGKLCIGAEALPRVSRGRSHVYRAIRTGLLAEAPKRPSCVDTSRCRCGCAAIYSRSRSTLASVHFIQGDEANPRVLVGQTFECGSEPGSGVINEAGAIWPRGLMRPLLSAMR